MLVVLSPAQSCYKALLPSSDIVFKNLFALQQSSGFEIINMYDDITIVQDEAFGGCNHLTEQGATKVTQKLRRMILGET